MFRTTFTPATENAAMPARLRGLYNPKININIHLNGGRKTYTTLDQIDGVVTIVTTADTSFDDIEIEFLGTCHTYVERLTTAAAVSGRSEAFHQFLKLTQPRLQQHYPPGMVLKAGETYRFPFVFVVPQRLLDRVCQHKADSAALKEAHLVLPPTFGDKDRTVKASERVDDMVPDMASIRYGVFVRISKMKSQDGAVSKEPIANKARRLRVIPTTEDLPPLDVAEDEEYSMRKEKTIRKGVLKGKLGTLVMEASQPSALRVRSSDVTDSQTMATIMLRFDPTDADSQPPRIGTLNSKLKVHTYFASTARCAHPTRTASALDLAQGLHTEQVNLSSRCMASVEWTKHEPEKPSALLERRDSAISCSSSMTTGATPSPSSSYKGKSFYVARLLVPISLPANKTFVPTFHSCLISRIYLLKLELNLATSTIGGGVELRVPLQIGYAGSSDGLSRNASLDNTSLLEAGSDDDVADFFEPRTIRAPSEEYVGRSRVGSQTPAVLVVDDAPPPEYYSFTSAMHAAGRGVSVH